MITNREIKSEALLAEALTEVVESARENDVDEETIAEALRERAAAVAEPADDPSEGGGVKESPDGGSATD
jgi:hypothetical protein